MEIEGITLSDVASLRGRGLKQFSVLTRSADDLVASLRGRGLKLMPNQTKTSRTGRLLTGAWIET